jgi:hypothetical protein
LTNGDDNAMELEIIPAMVIRIINGNFKGQNKNRMVMEITFILEISLTTTSS